MMYLTSLSSGPFANWNPENLACSTGRDAFNLLLSGRGSYILLQSGFAFLHPLL
jgi:hypothetical protein